MYLICLQTRLIWHESIIRYCLTQGCFNSNEELGMLFSISQVFLCVDLTFPIWSMYIVHYEIMWQCCFVLVSNLWHLTVLVSLNPPVPIDGVSRGRLVISGTSTVLLTLVTVRTRRWFLGCISRHCAGQRFFQSTCAQYVVCLTWPLANSTKTHLTVLLLF